MSKFKMRIIETTLSEEKLRELILKQDATFAPMGSGGYSIREKDGQKNAFVFIQQDCAPADSFFVRIKGGTIWAFAEDAPVFMGMLSAADIDFTYKTKSFKSPADIRQEFDKVA